MSLLLQALQKAAKNRDEQPGNPDVDADNDKSLSLEPLAEPQLAEETPSSGGAQRAAATASPEDAAGVMRANELPSYSALDWARDHYMLTFLALAALFAIFYGLYVYIQVSNPGMFRSPPPPVTAPIQTATAPPPAAEQPLRISGLPDAPAAGDEANPERSAGTAEITNDTSEQAAANGAVRASAARAEAPARAPRQPATVRATERRSTVSARRVAATTNSEGVEIIEIPASPSVAVLPEARESTGPNIEVEPQDGAFAGVDPGLLMAYEALQQGNHDKAGKLYSQVLSRAPNNIDALLGLAAIAWKQGRSNVASQYYGRVLEIAPRNSHAQAGLIAILGGADPVAAESKLKQLIGREPSGFLYFTLGNLYAEQGLWSQAQHAYAQAHQFQPDNSDYAFNLAVGLEHLGQPRAALDFYRKALDLSFRKGKANFDQGLAIERVGQLSARVE